MITHQGFNTLSPALQAVALSPMARFRLTRRKVVGFTKNTFEWANTKRRRAHRQMVASGYYARKSKEWRAKQKAAKNGTALRGLTAPRKQQQKSTSGPNSTKHQNDQPRNTRNTRMGD